MVGSKWDLDKPSREAKQQSYPYICCLDHIYTYPNAQSLYNVEANR